MSDAEPAYTAARTATVSSLKSELSTRRLLAAAPRQPAAPSPASHSAEAGSAARGPRRALLLLGLAQLVLGAALLGAGALAVARGAALARVGAGLWAGCAAVVAGVVGVLAGINDCYGVHAAARSPLVTAFLALSLLCVACGNSAAVLAASGLQRDAQRAHPAPHASFQEEQAAWSPVLANIAVLVVAALHCAVSVFSIYLLSKRVCPCFRKKPPFDHNQFEPASKAVSPYVIHVEEKGGAEQRARHHALCRDLDARLQPAALSHNNKKEEAGEFDSANSAEKLVTRWLGHHHSAEGARAAAARPERGERRGVRKQRARPAPLVLVPAHPATTLGRLPPACVMMAPRYATLPLPPAPLYYPGHDTRMRRRRSPRAPGERRRREAGRERDSQLARSLERIHRKRRTERDRLTDADLKRTYTGLDRAYAEQFIAVIDESRHAAELHDSLPSTASDSANSTGHDV